MIKAIRDFLGDILPDGNRVMPMPIPKKPWQDNYFPNGPRRSGRTTRMILSAVSELMTGKNIIIICGNSCMANNIRDIVGNMLRGMNLAENIRINRRDEIVIDLYGGRFSIKFSNRPPNEFAYRGIMPEDLPTVFYDHYYSETRQ